MTTTLWIVIGAGVGAVIGVIIALVTRHKSKNNKNRELKENILPQQEIQNDGQAVKTDEDLLAAQMAEEIKITEEMDNLNEQYMPDHTADIETQPTTKDNELGIESNESETTTQPAPAHGEPLNIAEIIEENIVESEEDEVVRDFTDPTQTYNLGRSGKVYTKEELDLLIKE